MPALTKEQVLPLVMTGASARSTHPVQANFKVGDVVKAKNINPTTHTRLARYVRGKVGTVMRDQGVFGTPETMAHGKGECPQHLYSVAFSATELWGAGAMRQDKVYIDLWDNHLEKVES